MNTNTKPETAKRIEVYFDYEESGYCRKYYRTLPNRQLICHQDPEGWYTVIEDGCWNEPNTPINEDKFNIVIVEKPNESDDNR